MSNWHAMTPEQVAMQLDVDVTQGLSEDEAGSRLRQYGPNTPDIKKGRSVFARLASQFMQPLILVLIGASLVTTLLGEYVDASVIFAVVLVNALVGFLQEGKAEAALAALARSVATGATVWRAGALHQRDAAVLVRGDVVMLAAGDKVPADVRLLYGKELRTAEAALTGESTPVDKRVESLAPDTPLAERCNMAYAGTLVVSGQGRAVVVATGNETQSGRISGLIANAPEMATPLTKKMAIFTKWLLVAILLLAGLTFAVGVARGESAFNMFMAAVALAVGAIPEGLPAAMTITLAIGVARMAKRGAIIRKLPAVETLGSTTVICSDKTGTLTENAMTVRAVWAGGAEFKFGGQGYAPHGEILCEGRDAATDAALREVLVAGALCNDAQLERDGEDWRVVGDPTEGALLVAAGKGDLEAATLQAAFVRTDALPFDSLRQYMATRHHVDGTAVVYVKGAVEKLLPACACMQDAQGQPVPLDASAIHAALAGMTEHGMRVLALARLQLAPGEALDHGHVSAGKGLLFLGLAGMIDPPREHAISAVRSCHLAGIRVKMITGDHPGTAVAIARQLGIDRNALRALTGQQLALMDDAALRLSVADVDIFARVEPEQKLRLVRALQANGEVVAMTGDGVNDAPALKQADIGVAMGLGGTEVAKEAADTVLTDDNFATIEAAVEAGRGIYDNLIKFIVWTLPTNAGEGMVVLTAVFLGTALPITPLQILWINMTTAILLGLMLAFEPTEPGIMLRPPRRPSAPIISGFLIERIVIVGVLMLIGAFGAFELALSWQYPLEQARTMAANVFVMVELFYLFNCRSLTRPFWSAGVFSNPWVWVGAAAMLALQLLFTYAPYLNRIFQTAPIGLMDWVWITLFAALCAVIVEIDKRWRTHHPAIHNRN